MNGKVHVWIVEDALRFVLAKGTNKEKQAFQAWETAYGGGDLTNTPSPQTRIVDVIGQESKYTDKYHDLAIYLESFAGLWQDDITEYDGHVFTALNHFLAVPWYPTCWWRTNGYHYFWSSKAGNDSKAMTGKVDYKDAEVDNDHSPIVDRCGFGWTKSGAAWGDNWEADIRYTVFAPVNVLAYYYYRRLLYKYFTHVDVNGERFDKINGMYILGPVVHAVADACVPQHAITAMGYKHQEWENSVESWVWGYELEDFNQVRDLLDNHMKRWVYTGGDLKDMLAIDYLVSELCGWKTFTKFLQLNGLNGINAMKSEAFWNNYMANLAKVKSDSKFFYNLALAATVRVITEACYDVIKTGGGSSSTPVIRGVSSYKLVGGIPERKPKEIGRIDISRGAELNYISANSLLGFKPINWRTATRTLFKTRENFIRWNKAQITDKEIALRLAELEKELLQQFKNARTAGLEGFERPETLEFPQRVAKLRQDCGLPDVSKDLETHSLFGLATFRPPTEEEINDDQKFKEYLKESEANVVNSKLLAVTRCIALHKLFYAETSNRIRCRKIDEAIYGLERMREFIIRTKRLPIEKWPMSRIVLKPVDLTVSRPTENVMEAT
jgi:hypothetical protein